MSHWQIRRDALGIGIAVGAYALSFGAISVASGLNVLQTQMLSALMFTGASQFALVGVLGTGGGAIAAVATAWMLGARNGLYALHLAPHFKLKGWRKVAAAQLTIDESTAMAMGHEDELKKHAFWATGISVYVLWNLGTLLGALGAAALGDPKTLGLDAAVVGGFVALLWPRLKDKTTWAVALGGAAVALMFTPFLKPGIPVLLAAIVAIIAGYATKNDPKYKYADQFADGEQS